MVYMIPINYQRSLQNCSSLLKARKIILSCLFPCKKRKNEYYLSYSKRKAAVSAAAFFFILDFGGENPHSHFLFLERVPAYGLFLFFADFIKKCTDPIQHIFPLVREWRLRLALLLARYFGFLQRLLLVKEYLFHYL